MHHLNKSATFRVVLVVVFLSILGVSIGSGSSRTAAQSTGGQDSVLVSVEGITWEIDETYVGASLSLVGPDGQDMQFEFSKDEAPSFLVHNAGEALYPDGGYSFELHYSPMLSETAVTTMENAAQDEREEVTAALLASGDIVPGQTLDGHFVVHNGYILVDDIPEVKTVQRNNVEDEILSPQAITDQVILDDLIVDGSICIGFDCANGENFGADTLRLKENNLRIHFQDTSNSASFPTNDWRIMVNDTTNGGASYFAIEDSDNGIKPFYIEDNTRNNALFISDNTNGYIGMGTSDPQEEIHFASGDTPTVRLDQDGSAGWPKQEWNIAGNEANFFIQDVTKGYDLQFRIIPGAPYNSLIIDAEGDIGFGIADHSRYVRDKLYLQDVGSMTTNISIDNDNGIWSLGNQSEGLTMIFESDVITTPVSLFTLDTAGNLTIEGALTEASDVNQKENFEDVNPADILRQIAGLRLSTWNYITDDDGVRHLGPMAQDFYASFELGADDTHIAPLDVNGVTLAGMQALIELNAEQDEENSALTERVEELEAENADLEARLAALEEQIQALLKALE